GPGASGGPWGRGRPPGLAGAARPGGGSPRTGPRGAPPAPPRHRRSRRTTAAPAAPPHPRLLPRSFPIPQLVIRTRPLDTNATCTDPVKSNGHVPVTQSARRDREGGMPETLVVELPDPAATEAFGRRLGAVLLPAGVVALVGHRGAGKTQLSRAVALGLGVPDGRAVTSPTFVLIQEYAGRLPVYHFDVYRLRSAAEFFELAAGEYLEGD